MNTELSESRRVFVARISCLGVAVLAVDETKRALTAFAIAGINGARIAVVARHNFANAEAASVAGISACAEIAVIAISGERLVSRGTSRHVAAVCSA